jgi:hypothetical protein
MMFYKKSLFSFLRKVPLAAHLHQSLSVYTTFLPIRMASTLPKLPVFEAIAQHDPHSPAVIHSASGKKFTYGGLLRDVAKAKDKLHTEAESSSISGQRIAFLVENSYEYVGAQTSYELPPSWR